MNAKDDKTHFIGVLPSPEIREHLERDREWVRRRYGCISGHSTPVHITLLPPFHSTLSTQDLRDALLGIAPLLPSFTAKVQGYGAFGNRTIFLAVEEDPRWTELSSSLSKGLKAMGGGNRVEKGPLIPHFTVANRDIPTSAFPQILSHYLSSPYSATFLVKEVALFHREGRLWKLDDADIVSLSSR